MELTFGDEDLAETCNRRHRLDARFGDHASAVVARRLLQLAAVDAAEIETLPGATLRRGARGALSIDFAAGEVIVRGVLLGASTAPERLRILRVDTRADSEKT